MDLGLKNLTDDQTLELLHEVLNELATRDGYVRQLAQQSILDETEKKRAYTEALETAVHKAKQEYVAQITQETLEAVRKGVQEGTVRLIDPSEEAKQVAIATLEAKIALIDEAVDQIKKGTRDRVYFQIDSTGLTFCMGTQRVETRKPVSSSRITEVGGVLRKLLTE